MMAGVTNPLWKFEDLYDNECRYELRAMCLTSALFVW